MSRTSVEGLNASPCIVRDAPLFGLQPTAAVRGQSRVNPARPHRARNGRFNIPFIRASGGEIERDLWSSMAPGARRNPGLCIRSKRERCPASKSGSIGGSYSSSSTP